MLETTSGVKPVRSTSASTEGGAKSSEFMRTSADFAANPIGTFFDPARVYDEMKAGADFRTLQKAIRAGEYQPGQLPDIGLPAP